MRNAFGFIAVVSLLGLPGVAIAAFGVSKLVTLRAFLSSAHVTSGRVVELTLLRSDDDGSTYRLTAEYALRDGSRRRVAVETRDGSYAPEQAIEVLYTDTQPIDARVRGINTTWTNPVIFTVVGIAWSLFAGLFLVIGLRSGPSTAAAP